MAFLQFGTLEMALLVSGASLLIHFIEAFLLTPEAGVPQEPLERIAFEKAGIAKPGVPLVTRGRDADGTRDSSLADALVAIAQGGTLGAEEERRAARELDREALSEGVEEVLEEARRVAEGEGEEDLVHVRRAQRPQRAHHVRRRGQAEELLVARRGRDVGLRLRRSRRRSRSRGRAAGPLAGCPREPLRGVRAGRREVLGVLDPLVGLGRCER